MLNEIFPGCPAQPIPLRWPESFEHALPKTRTLAQKSTVEYHPGWHGDFRSLFKNLKTYFQMKKTSYIIKCIQCKKQKLGSYLF